MKLNNRHKVIKNLIENELEKRDEVFKLIKEFENKHGFVPAEYKRDHKLMANYEDYKKHGSYKNSPIVQKLIMKAVKRFGKNTKKKNYTPEQIHNVIQMAMKK